MTDRPFTRRTLLQGGAAALAAAGASSAAALPASAAAALLRNRITLPSGVQSGDVTTDSAVLWARASEPGRLVARVTSGRYVRELTGPWAAEASDLTAKLAVSGLAPGREYAVELAFEDSDGNPGETQIASFTTASTQPAATSFVWTGDTCGQGWGINPDVGGLVGYRAMHQTRPDFFIHAGDTIYADGPIAESVTEPDGQVWRNLVTPEVSKVAESLGEFRGRHRYTLLDDNVRAMYADVPLVAQWDDHETHNNWYPGQILTDSRYTERRIDVLAARARQAFGEYLPLSQPGGRDRVYRKVARGPLVDVFCLDMRTYRDQNPSPDASGDVAILGAEQVDWLVREVAASKAVWKVIASDMPLGLLVPDGTAIEAVANGLPGAPGGRENEIATVLSAFKARGVRNTVWLTADVHYCAAHHYDPSRAAYTDFDPFWELVAGPINAGTFGPNTLDPTFGPKVEFVKAAAYPNQPPSDGNQFFGHVSIDPRTLVLTASLRDLTGTILWTRDLEPQR